jgi:hypothetical protein
MTDRSKADWRFGGEIVGRSYWVTTHWPALEDAEPDYDRIWVPEGRQQAGEALRAGDLVFVYESLGGRPELRVDAVGQRHRVPRRKGVEGIVALCLVQRALRADGAEDVTQYADGIEIQWRWHAPMKIVRTDGRVSRIQLNRILSYATGYNMCGFGDHHSGLQRSGGFGSGRHFARIRTGVPSAWLCRGSPRGEAEGVNDSETAPSRVY